MPDILYSLSLGLPNITRNQQSRRIGTSQIAHAVRRETATGETLELIAKLPPRGTSVSDSVADKAQVGSCVARLSATCHVANLPGVHSSLLSTGAVKHPSMLSTALLRRGIPPAAWNRVRNIMDEWSASRPLYRSGHCWPTCSLEQTGPIDLAVTHGNGGRQAGRPVSSSSRSPFPFLLISPFRVILLALLPIMASTFEIISRWQCSCTTSSFVHLRYASNLSSDWVSRLAGPFSDVGAQIPIHH